MSALQIPGPRLLLTGLGVAGAIAVIADLERPIGGHSPDLQANAAQVLIYDDKIVPVEAHILVDGAVEWADLGRDRHRIEGDTNGFSAFELAPRAHHEAVFTQTGKFPYTVDHELHGVIVVEAGQVRPARSPAELPPGARIVHYAAKLTVTTHHVKSTEGTDKSLDDNTIEWTGIWNDVALEIIESPADTRIYPVDSARGATGEITATVDYHLVTPDLHDGERVYSRGVDCADRLTQAVYPAGLLLTGEVRPGAARLEINAFPREPAGPRDPNFFADHDHRCNHIASSWAGRREFTVDPELIFEITPQTMAVKIRRQQSPIVFPPLDLILAHRAFDLTTGSRQESHDYPRSSDRSEWRATLDFTPR